MSHNDSETPGYLFLDIPVKQVLEGDGIQTEEPWGRLHINAIRERWFGNAIWTRYHMLEAMWRVEKLKARNFGNGYKESNVQK